MSHTLLMRLAGPMQSWGLSSRFSERDSGLEPSKSGVVGILAAALGRPRDGDVADLAALSMGVRADKEGVLSYDFHTAGASKTQPGIIRAQGRGYSTSISRRFHLQDAVFLVGLEGDDLTQIEALDVALREPVFPVGLGRRGHVPSCPVAMAGAAGAGVRRDTALAEALRQEPWPVAEIPHWQQRRLEQAGDGVRLVLEDPAGSITRPDQPVGAAFRTRVFGPRSVVVTWCQPPRRETDRDQ
ncbi:MAG: type I-E CRISPR-associated protein Cas5/CasD [Chloroflexota bacterium]|nr:type I-E CRISPR-associated protein Cas5/CasD [Chloroflexota bacterium]